MREEGTGSLWGRAPLQAKSGTEDKESKGPDCQAAWEWILLALCLWVALQMGAALVLKGNCVEGEVFAFNALRCDN